MQRSKKPRSPTPFLILFVTLSFQSIKTHSFYLPNINVECQAITNIIDKHTLILGRRDKDWTYFYRMAEDFESMTKIKQIADRDKNFIVQSISTKNKIFYNDAGTGTTDV